MCFSTVLIDKKIEIEVNRPNHTQKTVSWRLLLRYLKFVNGQFRTRCLFLLFKITVTYRSNSCHTGFSCNSSKFNSIWRYLFLNLYLYNTLYLFIHRGSLFGYHLNVICSLLALYLYVIVSLSMRRNSIQS